MKSSIFSAAPLLAAVAQAGPIVARQNIDGVVLNFALTLEHLENVFYKQALAKFSQQDFMNAGYSKNYYNNLKYIAHDEEQHVLLLTSALQAAGVTPVQACTYNFPYNDVKGFISLSSVLEGVGTSAYLGAAPLVTSKAYLSVAGSILVTEALHTSLQRSAIGEVPFANPYGTGLEPNSVFSLASAFIVSCPPNNTPLPFKAYPGLAVNGPTCMQEQPDTSVIFKRDNKGKKWGGWKGPNKGAKPCYAPKAGDKVSFTAAAEVPKNSYLTFVSGLAVTSVPAINGSPCNTTSAAIPAVVEGQTYVFVTSSDVEGTLDTSKILFGPAILEVAPQPPTYDPNQA